MASSFKILIHKDSENLHLKLVEDLDVTSANELLETIMSHGSRMNKIFIHTSGLKGIFPFVKTLFQNNFSTINNPCTRVIFTGNHANQLVPEERRIHSRA